MRMRFFFFLGGGGVPVRSTVYIIITFINSCMYKDYSNKKKLTPLNRLISLISWRMVFDLVTSDDDVTIPNKNTNRQTDVVKKSKYRMFLEPIFAVISQHSQNWLSKFTKEFHLQPGTLSREKARIWFFFSTAERSLDVFDFFYCFYPIMKLHCVKWLENLPPRAVSITLQCFLGTILLNNGRQLMTACNCIKI